MGVRITPAHAGKSAWVKSSTALNEDHPRPCGEKAIDKHLGGTAIGSPPPMRGKAHAPGLQYQYRGITPAHAGKSVHSPRRPLGL